MIVRWGSHNTLLCICGDLLLRERRPGYCPLNNRLVIRSRTSGGRDGVVFRVAYVVPIQEWAGCGHCYKEGAEQLWLFLPSGHSSFYPRRSGLEPCGTTAPTCR
jgi:hypothetical protein